MCSLINKQLLLTAYAYLFIMEQRKAQQGSEALQLQVETTGEIAKKEADEKGTERSLVELEDIEIEILLRPEDPSSADRFVAGYTLEDELSLPVGASGNLAAPFSALKNRIEPELHYSRTKVDRLLSDMGGLSTEQRNIMLNTIFEIEAVLNALTLETIQAVGDGKKHADKEHYRDYFTTNWNKEEFAETKSKLKKHAHEQAAFEKHMDALSLEVVHQVVVAVATKAGNGVTVTAAGQSVKTAARKANKPAAEEAAQGAAKAAQEAAKAAGAALGDAFALLVYDARAECLSALDMFVTEFEGAEKAAEAAKIAAEKAKKPAAKEVAKKAAQEAAQGAAKAAQEAAKAAKAAKAAGAALGDAFALLGDDAKAKCLSALDASKKAAVNSYLRKVAENADVIKTPMKPIVLISSKFDVLERPDQQAANGSGTTPDSAAYLWGTTMTWDEKKEKDMQDVFGVTCGIGRRPEKNQNNSCRGKKTPRNKEKVAEKKLLACQWFNFNEWEIESNGLFPETRVEVFWHLCKATVDHSQIVLRFFDPSGWLFSTVLSFHPGDATKDGYLGNAGRLCENDITKSVWDETNKSNILVKIPGSFALQEVIRVVKTSNYLAREQTKTQGVEHQKFQWFGRDANKNCHGFVRHFLLLLAGVELDTSDNLLEKFGVIFRGSKSPEWNI